MARITSESDMVSEIDLELPRIIAQAQTGDSGAFGELYAKYAGLILRYLYVRVRDQEGAQDLTQEVFVRVIKGIGGFEYRGEKSFLGWLYTIANNVLIGQARRKRAISTPLDDSIEIVDPRGQEAVLSIYERVALQLTAGLGLSALVLSLAALTAGSPMHAAILVATLVLILKGGRLGRRTRSHSE